METITFLKTKHLDSETRECQGGKGERTKDRSKYIQEGC